MLKKGFTLIELTIVIAIIAMLSTIALPNFLEAHNRTDISRSKQNLRMAATALETYHIDYNKYPYDGFNFPGSNSVSPPAEYNYWYLPYTMSTPVAYLSSANVIDPFRLTPPNVHWQYSDVRYRSVGTSWGTDFDGLFGGQPPQGTSTYFKDQTQEFGGFVLNASGPDRTYGPYGWKGVSNYPTGSHTMPYNATNGTLSYGDIMRSSISEFGYKNAS